MRHNKKFNHLGRKSAHRKALLSNLACSLFLHKRISTTVAKAKALQIFAEPLITKSKEDTTHNRRVVFSYLKSKTAVSELFREISPKITDRPGGYTRVLKLGNRLGDDAEMCIIELVDYNENMLAAKEDKKGTSRRRRSVKKKTDTAPEVPAKNLKSKTEKVQEKVSEEKQEIKEEKSVSDSTAEEASDVQNEETKE